MRIIMLNILNLKKIFLYLVVKLLENYHKSSKSSKFLSIKAENILARIRGLKIRFKLNSDGSIQVEGENSNLRISDLARGFWLYRNGIKYRAESLFNSYCLKNLIFNYDDVVFDCGANSGDLFLSLDGKINSNNYYAFEPNPDDYNILKLNVKSSSNIYNLALGDVDTELAFYTSTEGGDSSLIEPKVWYRKMKVQVLRLESFIEKNNIKRIKLLKIEAEGFEPEILLGLGHKITLCEYIAIDGGYERGKDCEQTFTRCTNYLLLNGFEMLDICFPAYRALYINTSSQNN